MDTHINIKRRTRSIAVEATLSGGCVPSLLFVELSLVSSCRLLCISSSTPAFSKSLPSISLVLNIVVILLVCCFVVACCSQPLDSLYEKKSKHDRQRFFRVVSLGVRVWRPKVIDGGSLSFPEIHSVAFVARSTLFGLFRILFSVLAGSADQNRIRD